MGTPNIDLEYLAPSQSQPEVIINANSDKLDAAFGDGSGIAVSNATASPPLIARATELQFEGSGVSVAHETGGKAIITISGGGGGSSDSGTPLSVSDGSTTVTDVSLLSFSGATVADTAAGHATVIVSGGGGGGGSGNVTPDTHPSSANALDDEFEGSSLSLSKWTWQNQVTSAASLANGSLIMTGVSDNNIHAITQPISDAVFRIRAKLALRAGGNGGENIGLIAANLSSGANILWGPIHQSSSEVIAGVYSNPWTYPQSGFTSSAPFSFAPASLPGYYEIYSDGTTFTLGYSATGVEGTYYPVTTYAVSSIGSVTGVGLGTRFYSASSLLICDWFRRVG